MATYKVTLQVNPNKVTPDFEDSFGAFKDVTVKASDTKQAHVKAVDIGSSNIVTNIVEVKATRKTWLERWQTLTNDVDFMYNNRYEFVCQYVMLLTQKKEQRFRVDGYQLKRVGSKYQILFNGRTSGYSAMTAENAFNWMVRIPLNKFALEAQQYRIELCMPKLGK